MAALLDLTPARTETFDLLKRATAFLPYLASSILITAFFAGLSFVVLRLARKGVGRRVQNPLLVEMLSKLIVLPVVLLGFYLVLSTCGLTGIAVTIVGGTGALGLVAGLAMKNILENYFAGIMLSLRHPYTVGDVVDIAGKIGTVKELTTRGTLLADFDNNQILIPNIIIYQNVVTNLSVNTIKRIKFNFPLDSQSQLASARQVMQELIRIVPGVLARPEPSIQVPEITPGIARFEICVWIDTRQSNGDLIKTQLLEKIKARLESAGFQMLSQARLLEPPARPSL